MKIRDHPDPEYRRWKRKYPRFPGVGECVRLVRTGKARGSWADIIVYELAEHATSCLPELLNAFQEERGESDAALFVVMALEIAALPETVSFFAELLRENDPRFASYAERGLRAINTPEARRVLWGYGSREMRS